MIHQFDNGIKVKKEYILPKQMERYNKINLHEPEEEEEFIRLVKGLGDHQPLFFDVGSAIGYYSILAKLNCESIRVFAFEPYDKYRKATEINWKLNFDTTDSIHIYDQALSSQTGSSGFVRNDYGSSLVYKKTFFQNVKSFFSSILNRNANVATIKLDDFIQRNGISKIDLIKMDIQGAELLALKGAEQSLSKHLIDRWIIGTHSTSLHNDCLAILKKHNYIIKVDQLALPNQPDGLIIAIKPK